MSFQEVQYPMDEYDLLQVTQRDAEPHRDNPCHCTPGPVVGLA
jgi:hypothetical protein